MSRKPYQRKLQTKYFLLTNNHDPLQTASVSHYEALLRHLESCCNSTHTHKPTYILDHISRKTIPLIGMKPLKNIAPASDPQINCFLSAVALGSIKVVYSFIFHPPILNPPIGLCMSRMMAFFIYLYHLTNVEGTLTTFISRVSHI